MSYYFRFTFRNHTTGQIKKVICDNALVAALATGWVDADTELIKTAKIEHIGPETSLTIPTGRPKIDISFDTLLTLRKQGLGWQAGAKEYTRLTGQYISPATFKRRYREGAAK